VELGVIRVVISDGQQRLARMATRIPLRSPFYRRPSSIEARDGAVALHLLEYYGRGRPFRIPIANMAVVGLKASTPLPLEDWFAAGVRIIYLPTLGQIGRANLLLLFEHPERVPPVGWRGFFGLPLPRKEVNAPSGLWVDGVALQARRPTEAVAALASAGVEEVVDPETWMAARREVLTDPAKQAERRRAAEDTKDAEAAYQALDPAPLRGALFGLAGLAVGAVTWAALAVLFEIQSLLVAVGAGLLIGWLAAIGARRTTDVLKVLLAAEALATVLIGELLAMVVATAHTPASAVRFYLANLAEVGADLGFAAAGGLLGAYAAVQQASARPAGDVPAPQGLGPSERFFSGGHLRALVLGAILVSGVAFAAAVWLFPGATRDEDGVITARGGLDVYDLREGDCFDEPAGTEVVEVTAVPCDQQHDAEVYLLLDLPFHAGAPFPSEDELLEAVEERCIPAFRAFLDRGYAFSKLDYMFYSPSEPGWADGDRSALCAIVTMDGSQLEGTARGSRQ
jgi:hypothetical protein